MTRLSEPSQRKSAISIASKRDVRSGETFVSNIRREALVAHTSAVEARSAFGLGLDIEVIVEHVERRGFISRSSGNPNTDNPFAPEAEHASVEPARQIKAILCAVWARGWDKADRELTGI